MFNQNKIERPNFDDPHFDLICPCGCGRELLIQNTPYTHNVRDFGNIIWQQLLRDKGREDAIAFLHNLFEKESRSIKRRQVPRFMRTGVGGLFLLAGIVIVGAEIYFGWQDGGWNRYPLSMLMVDTFHFIGRMMGDMIPVFQNAAEGLKGFEISKFPFYAQRFLVGIPMASLFLFTAYIFMKWEKLLSRV
jgi:hypothetical protein